MAIIKSAKVRKEMSTKICFLFFPTHIALCRHSEKLQRNLLDIEFGGWNQNETRRESAREWSTYLLRQIGIHIHAQCHERHSGDNFTDRCAPAKSGDGIHASEAIDRLHSKRSQWEEKR